MPRALHHPPADLVELDRFEERAEVALAETLIALALDDLEEDRADDVLREDLQQHALAFLRIAVDQDAPALELCQLLPVTGNASVHAFIVRIRRVLERHALPAQNVYRAIDVRRSECDVLDAL